MANDNLTGQTIAGTYNQLLITADTGGIPGSGTSATQIHCGGATAGAGNADTTPLYLSTDRVGIGTGAPGELLHIKSTSANVILKLETTNNGSDPQLLLKPETGSGWNIVADDSDQDSSNAKLKIYNAQSPAHVMTFAGTKVGIGTEAPDAQLEVETTGSNDAVIHVDGGDDARLNLDAGSVADTSNIVFQLAGVSTGSINYKFNSTADDASMVFNTQGGDRMTILGNGNVGIGTAEPGAPLHLYTSSGSITGLVSSDSLADTESTKWQAHGQKSGGADRYAEIGVRFNNHAQAAGYCRFDSHDNVTAFVWLSSSTDIIRASSNYDHIGEDSAGVALSADITSDERLKNISSDAFPYGLAEINKLVPIKYSLKKDKNNGQSLGFGAQTTKPIIPEVITDTEECIDGYTWECDEDGKQTKQVANSSGKDTKLAMSYIQIVPVLVKAIQELSAKVEALENT